MPLSKVVNSLSCSIASPLSQLLSPASPCIDCCWDLDTGQHLHLDNSSTVRVSSGEPTRCRDVQRLGHGRHLNSRRQQKWLTAPFGGDSSRVTIRITENSLATWSTAHPVAWTIPGSAKSTKRYTTDERYDERTARCKGDNGICVSNRAEARASSSQLGGEASTCRA